MTPAMEGAVSTGSQSDDHSLQENEADVRERIDTLANAIRIKNIDHAMTHYVPDVVIYDLLPPLDVHGVAAYRKNYDKWFATMAGRINYEMSDLHISAGDTHATSHCISHVTGARAGGGRADYWVRVTTAWRKVHGEWLIAHEHISMPTMM